MTNPANLYRRILRTHRMLPREIRFVGDQYVKSEFRSHRNITDKKYLIPFFTQWAEYLALLQKQTGGEGATHAGASRIGRHMDPELIDRLDDDKAEQLLELHRASQNHDTQSNDGAAEQGAVPPKRK
ncbi:hypothetical protein IW148_002713 [Coemansia sp. RSA 1199]|nr:hypothetical protein IW148_002713 [Coemansia sp. RSA 1199]